MNETTVHFDRLNWELHIGEDVFKVVKGIEPILGSKKVVYHLEGTPRRVIKTVQTESMPGRPEFNLDAKFKALYEAIEREDILDQHRIPHLHIISFDKHGPPYRYFTQEEAPLGSRSAADLIHEDSLTEEDIRQMASYISEFESEGVYQLDTNPYNWYRIVDEDGNSKMVYVDGKVYLYDKEWEFRKVGLLQWLDSSFLSQDDVYTARIPRDVDFEELRRKWHEDIPTFAPWKKYLPTLLQP